MWSADKLVYRGEDNFIRAYQGSELVWYKPSSNNKIFYTSTNGQIVTPYSNDFGANIANIVSNTYSEGVGIIEFDGDVTEIGNLAFYGRNLQTIVIPDSVTSIGDYAFVHCLSLRSINIPDGVTSIGQGAFQACSLTSITIPNSVTSIGSVAFNWCKFTSITIPNSVTSIGQSAFAFCPDLISITIPNSIRRIDIAVFEGCNSLTSITIPNSVRDIEYTAFKDCNQLSEVIVNAVTPPELYPEQYTGIYDQFENNAPGRKIKVPAGSVNEYKAATGWSDYASDIISQ